MSHLEETARIGLSGHFDIGLREVVTHEEERFPCEMSNGICHTFAEVESCGMAALPESAVRLNRLPPV
jgi:hypothetical protein